MTVYFIQNSESKRERDDHKVECTITFKTEERYTILRDTPSNVSDLYRCGMMFLCRPSYEQPCYGFAAVVVTRCSVCDAALSASRTIFAASMVCGAVNM